MPLAVSMQQTKHGLIFFDALVGRSRRVKRFDRMKTREPWCPRGNDSSHSPSDEPVEFDYSWREGRRGVAIEMARGGG